MLAPAVGAGCAAAPHAQAADSPDGAAPALAFVGASVLPMTDARVLASHTVVVRGDRIVAIAPDGRVALPAGATRIDARGKYLVPGLVDMHVHFDGAEHERDLPLYLANGVTTVRNMRGTPAHVDMRERIARGALVGPTVYTAGPYPDRVPASVDVEQIVRQQRLAGYDFLKVHDHGFPRERYVQLAARARAHGMPLLGHVPQEVGVETAVREGHRTIEHVENLMQTFFAMQLDTTRFPALVTALRGPSPGARTCVVPTLVVFGYVVRHLEEFPQLQALQARPELVHVREPLRAAWAPERNSYVRRGLGREAEVPRWAERSQQQFAFLKAMTRALHDGGIPLAAGSDAGVPYTLPGYSLVEELALLQASGMSSHAALRAATRTAAECMQRETEFGSIAPGTRADLVLLDRDPLGDLRAISDPAGVVVRGRWLPRAALRAALATRAPATGAPATGAPATGAPATGAPAPR
jgi:imidazolonepropionase-like amidohydrolase